jgi:CBS domain-containing protein
MNTPIKNILGNRFSEVFSVPFDATVTEAVQEMNRRGVGSVLIMVDDQLVGIFTERDVLTRVIAANRDPRTTQINRVMTNNPATIGPDDTIEKVMALHSGKHFRHMPVVENGRVIGMISVRDLFRYLSDVNSEKAEKLSEYIESGCCVT